MNHIRMGLLGNTREIASFILDYSLLKNDRDFFELTGNTTFELVRLITGRGLVGENGKTLYQFKDIDAFICFSLSEIEKINCQEKTNDNTPFYNAHTMSTGLCLTTIKKDLSINQELVSAVNKKGALLFFIHSNYLGSLLSLDIPKEIVSIIAQMLVALEFKEVTRASFAFFKAEIINKQQKVIDQPMDKEKNEAWCSIV